MTSATTRRSQSNVVRFKNYLPPPPPKQKSLYELYPSPFFNRDTRCLWDVKPTGHYGADCETGRAYAIEFLKSCDGSIGWAALMGIIAADMIRAGPTGAHVDGRPKINGVVIGFMRVIGEALTQYCTSAS